MTILVAEKVKELTLEELPGWIEESPGLRRRAGETVEEIPARPLRQALGVSAQGGFPKR